MTSTDLVRSEIKRFLGSKEPEVICITGDWGVGKTYTWQTELDAARAKKEIGLERYSYASLFGVNSLDGLKATLVENLEFQTAPPENYADKGFDLVKSLTAKVAKYNKLAEGIPGLGKFLSKAGPLYFSAVRNQIICIDDLERRGTDLELRDVFGIISFLREQRGCKVVLLLNDEKLEESKVDFDTLFEKVIDAKLVFAPTAREALDIALKTDDSVAELLRGYCETLGISNIRVVKKIERLVRQIVPHLTEFSQEVTQQAVHSLVLFGWSKFQPTIAPPLDYFRVSSVARYLSKKHNKEQPSPEEEKWSLLLSRYGFMNLDEFDGELAKFVDSGVLDVARITARAEEQNRQVERQKKTGSLQKAWAPFHDSFGDNLDEVTCSIVDGMKANVAVVSLANLDAAIAILQELEKNHEAKDILEFFVANKPKGFWNPSDDVFLQGPLRPAVAELVAAQQKAVVVAAAATFNPEAELIQAAKSYNNDAIKKLAEVPVDEYYRMFKSKKGDELGTLVLSGLEFRRISNASPEMLEVVRRTEEALKKIASESKLNAVRVRKFGVKIP